MIDARADRDEASAPRTVSRFVFGDEPRQRLRLARTLTSAVVYLSCILLQWGGVLIGRGSLVFAVCLTVSCLLSTSAFFVLIRTGYSRRFKDAALTMPQMVAATVFTALAYYFNPQCRGVLPIIEALVLVFGAFILPSRQCRHLGGLAVVAFACVMGIGAWRQPLLFDPTTEAISFLVTAVVLSTIAFIAGQLSQLRIDQHAQAKELRDVMERLERIATHDDLTGLPNRRHVQDWMSHEIARCRRQGSPLCLAFVDLDRFKRINDTLGHAVGDLVLQHFARETRTILRNGDVLARWGGEEFLLVMPDTTIAEAIAAIDRARTLVGAPARWVDYPKARVTFSAGLTELTPSQTLDEALKAADLALYEAKAEGRDRTVVSGSPARGPRDSLFDGAALVA